MSNINKSLLIMFGMIGMLFVLSGCKQLLQSTNTNNVNQPVEAEHDGDVMEKEDGDAMEKEDGDAMEKVDGDVMEKEDGDAMEKEDGDVMEKEDGDAMEKEDGDVMEEAEGQTQVFDLTGRNFAFSQNEIRVKKGEVVTINFASSDGFHDWVVDELDAKTSRVNTGGSTSVTFVANQIGTFEYYCSVGTHRALGMKGNLIVE